MQKIDVRIVAATHQDLEEMIRHKLFREDLYYRLNVVTINIPPLRRRRNDIPLLIQYFIDRFSSENGKNISGISKEALDHLIKYDFPGNVRELENTIERAVIMSRGEYIIDEDLPGRLQVESQQRIFDPANLDDSHSDKLHAFEVEMLREALRRNNGNQSAAARALDITERHLRSRLEKLGLKNEF
jgi:DNA-binding NtrC family response regulator